MKLGKTVLMVMITRFVDNNDLLKSHALKGACGDWNKNVAVQNV
jgi:hypothetical protein